MIWVIEIRKRRKNSKWKFFEYPDSYHKGRQELYRLRGDRSWRNYEFDHIRYGSYERGYKEKFIKMIKNKISVIAEELEQEYQRGLKEGREKERIKSIGKDFDELKDLEECLAGVRAMKKRFQL